MRSSDKYSDGLEMTLRRSRLAEAFVATGAAATLALTWASPLAWELQVPAIGWVGAAALHALRRLRAVARLRVERSGEVRVDGVSGELRDGSFVAPWLTVVRWRPRGAWLDRTLPLVPDMLGADDFRRLRILLKFGDRPLNPLGEIEKRTKGSVPELGY
jgi:toxin CptA